MFSPLLFIYLNLSSSSFQERGKDFGRLYSARMQNVLNAASVADEEQEEMRRVFAVGCDCPKTLRYSGNSGISRRNSRKCHTWTGGKKQENVMRGGMLMSDGAEIPMCGE